MMSMKSKLNLIEFMTVDVYENYKMHTHVYKLELITGNRQQKNFFDFIIFIQKIIFVQIVEFIIKDESHSGNYFRIFKQHFCLSDETKGFEIEARYHQLCKESKHQNMNVGLQEGLTTYNDEKKYDIAEMSDKRIVKIFLKIIKIKKINFADNQLMQLIERVVEDVDVYELIEKFRQFIRLFQSTKKLNSITHSAFAINQSDQTNESHVHVNFEQSDHFAFSSNDQFSSSAQSQKRLSDGQLRANGNEKKSFNRFIEFCFCLSSFFSGTSHLVKNCRYLRKKFRLQDGILKSNEKTRIDHVMKDKNFRKKIDKNIKGQRKYYEKNPNEKNKRLQKINKGKNSKGNNEDNNESNNQNANQKMPELKTFFSIYCIVVVFISFFLQNFGILDDEVNGHVCNKYMKDRFIKQRNGSGLMAAKAQKLFIEAWKTVKLTLQIFNESKEMCLINVIYVLQFFTNVVCQDLLCVKGLFFDNGKLHFHKKKIIIAFVKRFNDHYLMKNNTKNIIDLTVYAINIEIIFVLVFESKIHLKLTSFYEWHQMLKHVSKNVIQYLSASVEKMKLSNVNFIEINVFKIHQCQSCALAKSHRIIFCLFDNVETSIKFFYRIIFDLMQLASALNKNEWVSHVACHAIDFNLIFIHFKKSKTIRTFRRTISLIETKFNEKVIFIRSNEKRILDTDFDDLLIKKDINGKSSAFDTSTQNDHSKRKNDILIMKIKTIKIDVELSFNLGSKFVAIANYLINQTFMKKHDGKTSFELIVDHFSNLAHLHQYDCKICALNKTIFKKQKMQKRAHIDHLIDYEIRNIFRIGILSQHKVIKIRDVIFDDQTTYGAGDIDLLQPIRESMLKKMYEASNMKAITQIIELKSDEDDEINFIFHTDFDQGPENSDGQSNEKKMTFIFFLHLILQKGSQHQPHHLIHLPQFYFNQSVRHLIGIQLIRHHLRRYN